MGTAKLLAEYESRNSHPGENIDTPKADLEMTTQHRVASRESVGMNCSNCSTFCSSLSAYVSYHFLDFRSSVLWCYRYEYLVFIAIWFIYLIVCTSAQAPGCPRGYHGPGGLSPYGKY